MSHPDDPLFNAGRPNPALAGIPLRFDSSGAEPDAARIAEAARILARPVKYVDANGYDQEIIAAAIGPLGAIAYVACEAKELAEYVDVSFEFRLRGDFVDEVASEIASYNPYFGCDVRFLEWFGSTAVLIYREKHDTYIAECFMKNAAQYKPISDYWVINGERLGFWKYKGTEVRIFALPTLEELEPMSEAQAVTAGLCPAKHW
jgi:hypothetical protein